MTVKYVDKPTRKWIIPKERRSCARCDRGKNTIIIDEAAGSMVTRCEQCACSNVYQLRDFIDKRACKCCGYVRRVRVTIMMGGEHHEEHCDICKLLISAEKHERTARDFKSRAAKLIQARKSREAE
jgi:hypothetical protein